MQSRSLLRRHKRMLSRSLFVAPPANSTPARYRARATSVRNLPSLANAEAPVAYPGACFAVLLVAVVGLGFGRWAWVTQTAPPSRAVPAAALADPNGRFIRVNGIELYFTEDESPDGTPIVLVHGLLGSTADFAELAKTLAANRFRVLAVDRPPFGLSDKRAGAPMTPAAQADLLVAWLDALGIQRAAWLGHGAGGAVVAQVALRHPHRVSKLVLVAPLIGNPAAELDPTASLASSLPPRPCAWL